MEKFDRQPLFKRFLKDARVYGQCRKYWQDLLLDCVKQGGATTTWYVSPIERWGNGSVRRDGNPLVIAFNDSRSKWVRIIQEKRYRQGLPIAAYMDKCFASVDPDIEADELVIFIAPSRYLVGLARRLISVWVANDLTAKQMDNIIAEVLKSAKR